MTICQLEHENLLLYLKPNSNKREFYFQMNQLLIRQAYLIKFHNSNKSEYTLSKWNEFVNPITFLK